MLISGNFDSGNIRIVDKLSEQTARLEILPDPGTEFLHWFHFRCAAEPGKLLTFHLVNAGDSKKPDGWCGYRAVASYDRENWFRIDTTYRSGVLSFSLTPQRPVVYFAHFAPYSLDRHAELISWCQTQEGVSVQQLGESVEGRPIDLVTLGKGPFKIWIVAGQHPGEPMGPWFVEGLLKELVTSGDTVASSLLAKARFFIVPTANPDGSFSGRLRTNAAGVDLNRAWRNPEHQTAPEILCVLDRMEKEGVNFCLDIHGDESNPHCFIVNSDSVPGIDPDIIAQRRLFEDALDQASPDFVKGHGYKQEAPGTADLNIGANWVTDRFKCLALTVEQPFKDLADQPRTEHGWSPERSMRLGADMLKAINALIER